MLFVYRYGGGYGEGWAWRGMSTDVVAPVSHALDLQPSTVDVLHGAWWDVWWYVGDWGGDG